MKCLMNGFEVNYPCSPVCALFGDCVTAFKELRKANVRTKADRIRAMTDEELARQFALYEYSVAKEVLAHFGVDISTMGHDAEAAAKDLLEQLQQPAEVDA